MTFRTALAIIAGVFTISAFHVTAGAQAPASVLAGAYTAAQAKRGSSLYDENCAACHGADLKGQDPIPGLAGGDFQSHYKSVGDLFDKISMTMPAIAPGSLTGPQVADVIAYMLSVNKYPEGQTELAAKMEPLMLIKIEPAK
jgi:mono/diheme cytochrome c family protein